MDTTTLEKKRRFHTAFKLKITDCPSQCSYRMATLSMHNAVETQNDSSTSLATLVLYSMQTKMHVYANLEW